MGTENAAISISVQILNCTVVSPRLLPRLRAKDCEISKGNIIMSKLTISPQHVPPTAPFPLPLSAVQVGHSIGNLR